MPWIKVPKLSGSHPLVVANAVIVRLFWSLNGKLAYNVLGGSVGGGYTNSQVHADALATAVLAGFTSSGLKALSASTTELQGAGIRDIRSANLVEYSQTGSPVAGTGAGDPMPNEVAAVVTLRTAFAGKHFRGRVYISGANEAQNDAAESFVRDDEIGAAAHYDEAEAARARDMHRGDERLHVACFRENVRRAPDPEPGIAGKRNATGNL